jgi:hypothetical protein
MLRAPGDSVTLARPTVTRTEANFDFKLCLWRFAFLNRTKPTKYEALEKNAVSRPIVPKIGNLRYSRDPRKPLFCLGIFGLFVDAKARTPGRVAEGEELGSNLLRVFQSSPARPSVKRSKRVAAGDPFCVSGYRSGGAFTAITDWLPIDLG